MMIPAAERERLLVVNDPGDLARFVRGRYPQFDVNVAPGSLAGIASLAHGPARGVLLCLDATTRKLDHAIAGLRKAAGEDVRLVLCCQPSGEPVARQAMAVGADDYVIYPPQGTELDEALALPTPVALETESPTAPAVPTWEELTSLSGILAGLNSGRKSTLDKISQLIAGSLRAEHVRIVTHSEEGHIGNRDIEAALTETISSGGRTLGKILVGPRHHQPFTPDEAEKLRHYARLTAHLLDTVERQEEWQSLAMMDETSQLPNRRCLLQQLGALLRRAANERFRVTVLIFDLDGFKHFNDTYGHAAGDAIIRETSQLLRQCCRQHDIVARYAGDEFVVVFWDAEEPRVLGSKHPGNALAVLRRFKQVLVEHEFKRLGPEAVGCITISGGLANFPWDGKAPEELIERADEALLQAKRDGKNRIYLVGSDGEPVDSASVDEHHPPE
jgi:diguanylate cyclase (GGDEF)-like protein